MHGEYKLPGGKLVIVDFAVADDTLRDVVVSGDFFLYPEEALEPIRAALEGIPTTLSEADVAARVRDAIAPDVELIGATPEGIAIAVARALAA